MLEILNILNSLGITTRSDAYEYCDKIFSDIRSLKHSESQDVVGSLNYFDRTGEEEFTCRVPLITRSQTSLTFFDGKEDLILRENDPSPISNRMASFEGLDDISVKDKSLLFNTDLVETLEFDNLISQALTPMDSAYNRKESRGAHAREDFTKRDDKNFMKHTLAWQKGKKVEIKYRDVHSRTLTNDVQYFPPKERVY